MAEEDFLDGLISDELGDRAFEEAMDRSLASARRVRVRGASSGAFGMLGIEKVLFAHGRRRRERW